MGLEKRRNGIYESNKRKIFRLTGDRGNYFEETHELCLLLYLRVSPVHRAGPGVGRSLCSSVSPETSGVPAVRRTISGLSEALFGLPPSEQ